MESELMHKDFNTNATTTFAELWNDKDFSNVTLMAMDEAIMAMDETMMGMDETMMVMDGALMVLLY